MWLIGALLVIGVIVLIVVLVRKKPSANTTTNTVTTTPGAPCVPYTQAMQDRDISLIKNKCNPKLLIPIIGIGEYNNCVTTGKASLPLINNCGQ